MTKSLRSYPKSLTPAIALARIERVVKEGAIKGLGYWAAIDYLARTAAPAIVAKQS